MRPCVPLALAICALAAGSGLGESVPSAFATAAAKAEEAALRKVLERYVKAIEGKDLSEFRAVKPNLSVEEEQRARKAFESVRSQVIVITVQSAEVGEGEATLRVSRRDTINHSIVSSFPQTFTLARDREGWTIQAITGR